jgi:hypothetical protein
LALAAGASKNVQTGSGGLCLNEDNSHYFYTRAGQKFTPESVASWVDQYAGSQVKELILSANSQRTSFSSKSFDPIWKGYDPKGPDDQPLFASTPAEARAGARKWVHTAWELNNQGIDAYALWIARARQKKLSPWISMRMNDLHNVDDEKSYMHSDFWRQHPEFRRMPWRTSGDWRDRAFDFEHAEVRDYHFRLIEEYCERYDFDGLELDWMRFGFHFKPGRERQGAPHLDAFMARTRELLNTWEKKRRHKILLGARVPTRPQTAWAMGMDGAKWVNDGSVQMLVATPFWASIETDIPMEQWRQLIGNKAILGAGLELLLRPYHDYKIQYNTIQTLRGAAASLLRRGADRIYLFNYMDSQTAMPDIENYQALLHECGELKTLAGKPRRHVVTYSDTWAPGEQQGAQLPRSFQRPGFAMFRLHTGPAMSNAKLRLELEGASPDALEIRLNGAPTALTLIGEAPAGTAPHPQGKSWFWDAGRTDGWTVVDVQCKTAGARIHWVEIAGS